MKKTNKILATIAAVGALAVSGAVLAQQGYGFHHQASPDQPGCWMNNASMMQGQQMQRMAPGEFFAQRYESLGNILTLKSEQQAAWKAYVDARIASIQSAAKTYDTPAVDVQTRMQRRAERSAVRAADLKKVADTRAALLKVLTVEQKYVLESYEFNHRGMGHRAGGRAMGHGFGMGYGAQGAPMMAPDFVPPCAR